MTNRNITEAPAAVRDAADRAPASRLDAQATRDALLDAAALITLLDRRAFPSNGDDTREQVVVTVHGVDVSVRGRSRDLFVHIENIRDDRDQQTLPLSVEVNNAGEMTYSQGWDTAPLCEGCWDLPAVDLALMRCASCRRPGPSATCAAPAVRPRTRRTPPSPSTSPTLPNPVEPGQDEAGSA